MSRDPNSDNTADEESIHNQADEDDDPRQIPVHRSICAVSEIRWHAALSQLTGVYKTWIHRRHYTPTTAGTKEHGHDGKYDHGPDDQALQLPAQHTIPMREDSDPPR